MYQAMDSFVAALKSGAELRVMKGEVLPDKHELVLRDQAGSKTLFRKLNLDDEDVAPPAGPKPKASLNLGRKTAS
jgi:hypothetical protein